MLKTFIAAPAVAVLILTAPAAFAEDTPKDSLAREAQIKLNSNAVFLKTASRIVEDGKSEEARSFIKMAEGFAEEGKVRFDAGEFRLAMEDLEESTQDAIHAIILTRNGNDPAIRELVMQEGLMLRERHDRARKEAMVAKGVGEVETFIRAAEKLLAEKDDKEARANIEESKRLYEASKAALASEDYDSALREINAAYKLATKTVKAIKASQNDIITFPKPPRMAGEKELLSYELKKHDAYVFFADQMVKSVEAEKIYASGKAERARAMKSADSGDAKAAIEGLRASTEIIIKAINASMKKE